LPDGLGTCLSQMYREHTNNSDTTTPLLQQETDHSQELPPPPPRTTNNNNYSHSRRDPWLKKLWPSRINPTNEEQEEDIA